MKLIDLSRIVEDAMPVYPGDSKVCIYQSRYLNSDGYNDHKIETGMHSGTHIDSPMHLTDSKEYIYEARLESFAGDGCILDVRNQPFINAAYGRLIKDNSIVLIYTGYDKLYGTKEYYEGHPCITQEFCEVLIKKSVKMLGMDMPSPDKFPFEMHKLLFKNNIYILENLTNLGQLLEVKSFEVYAFPLKIKADSSMTRAVARILE